MKSNTEAVCIDNGIEISVEYEYEMSESQHEEGHGIHEVGQLVGTDLKVVEVIIAGKGFDITNLLNKRQKEAIISKLTYQ